MPSKITLAYATKEDVEEFYGAPSLYSCRAVIARLDDKPVGLGGVYRVGKNMVVFSEIREEMRPYKKDILRACRMAMGIIKRYTTVIAYPDPNQATADTFGNHFGFMHTGVTVDNRAMMVRINNGPS
jgi:hypothetical protein